MRYLCALLLSVAAFAQTLSISVLPGLPTTGTPTTLVLRLPVGVPVTPATWQFGDGQSLISGTVITHLYRQAGIYTVSASGQFGIASTQIRVVNGTGPAAPFAISRLRLRWDDGRTDMSVSQGFRPLAAFADLKFEGTGLLQAQWTLDGVPLGTFVRQLGFAAQVTLDTGMFLSLPTTELGEHFVSLRILTPVASFQAPTIRYFVRADDADNLPRIDDISPAVLRRGEEMELRVSGRGFGPGVRLSFGRDVALVSKPRFSDPGHAVVTVFVAPTARMGLRDVLTTTKGKQTYGPARLQILPALPTRAPASANGQGATPRSETEAGVHTQEVLVIPQTAIGWPG